ncbi:tudor and KH domain-containing protein homolog isoform X1 [Hylaeus volcanicus]|uniref:tudor and KH domain-containing protein homolog isoform X1 n=1 Tax=Hylaeus volcanicus TaxID=313075 RepID=UPI0023B7DF15|nr:tudor and KH domain-containing protein homolog isoform X1 [Hylaeus volcanicus]
MKWLPRQITLPLLLGVSLTSISIAFIYLLYKQDEDDANSRRKKIQIVHRISIEYKVPRQFVPAVIGRGGSVVKDVQNKTGTQIYFKEDNLECPDRICIIRGTFEAVHFAEEMIKSIIENQPIIETYEMYVPQNSCGRIIGRGGESIMQIQASSRAKVIIESGFTPYDLNAERRIIIKGTAEQIASALSQIEDKVREDKESYTKVQASAAVRLPRGKSSLRNSPVNSTEHLYSTESSVLQVTDGLMEIYVSAMENPSQFWIQVVGHGTTALDKLVSDMAEYYSEEENRELHRLKNVTLGQVVAAKFSFDELWYRAEVISEPEDGQCEVYFMDYGDHEVVQLDSILELRTNFLSLRLQAIECSLAGIKPRDGEWSTEACDRFSELTSLAQWKPLIGKVRGYKERAVGCGKSQREGTPIPCIDIYDRNDNKDINIRKELILEGHGEPEEASSSAASSTLSLSMRSHEATSTSRAASVSPLAKRVVSVESSMQNQSWNDYESSPWDFTAESPQETTNTSITDFDTHAEVEVVDLRTPRKPDDRIVEIDLTTPAKVETSRFIDTEKRAHRDGDSLKNGSSSSSSSNNQRNGFRDPGLKVNKSSLIAPAGYESDISADSDDFELG